MATSTIKTQLQLDSSEYQKKIKDAKQSMDSFKKSGELLSGALSKFAGVAGVCISSMEAFNRVIDSSQTIGDSYRECIEGIRASIDQMFYSISNGDFTPFLSGMSNVIELAKEAAKAMDQLGNTTMSYGYFSSKYQADFQDAIAQLRDKQASSSDKKSAVKQAQDALSNQRNITSTYYKESWNALLKNVRSVSGLKNLKLSQSDVENAFFVDVSKMPEQMRKKYSQEYSKFKAEEQKIENKYIKTYSSPQGGSYTRNSDPKAMENELTSVISKYKEAIVVNTLLVKLKDEDLQKQMQIGQNAYFANREVSSMTKTLNRAMGKGETSTPAIKKISAKKSSSVDESLTEGSIAFYERQISNLKTDFNNAADERTRSFIQAKIDELQKIIEQLNKSFLGVNTMESNGASGITGLVPKGAKNPTESLEGAGDALRNIGSPFSKEDINTNKSFAGSLNDIATVMGNLSGNIGEGASNWIKWGANLLTSIAAAIPAIGALTVEQKGLANASMESAVAGAASSNSSIPIVGAILAAASVATVIAAIMSAPKFASGGIVPGGMTIGDNVWARLNSGELILNKAQQNNIAGQLSSPSSRMEITVKGEIDGRKLKILSDKVNRYYSRM
jgi:hypothetical protein